MEMLAAPRCVAGPGSAAMLFICRRGCSLERPLLRSVVLAAPVSPCLLFAALSLLWLLLLAPLLQGSCCRSVLGICHELPLPLKEGTAAVHLPLSRRDLLSLFLHRRGAAVGRKGKEPSRNWSVRLSHGRHLGTWMLDPTPPQGSSGFL